MNNKNKTIEQQEDFDKRLEELLDNLFGLHTLHPGQWGLLNKFILSEKAKAREEERKRIEVAYDRVFPKYTEPLEEQRHRTFLSFLREQNKG